MGFLSRSLACIPMNRGIARRPQDICRELTQIVSCNHSLAPLSPPQYTKSALTRRLIITHGKIRRHITPHTLQPPRTPPTVLRRTPQPRSPLPNDLREMAILTEIVHRGLFAVVRGVGVDFAVVPHVRHHVGDVGEWDAGGDVLTVVAAVDVPGYV